MLEIQYLGVINLTETSISPGGLYYYLVVTTAKSKAFNSNGLRRTVLFATLFPEIKVVSKFSLINGDLKF